MSTELIRDFVNTRDLLDGVEELATPAEVGSWLVSHGLAAGGTEASADDLTRAHAERESERQGPSPQKEAGHDPDHLRIDLELANRHHGNDEDDQG